MPTYDYHCDACGGFSVLRPLAERDQPAVCPLCGASAPRVLFASPMLRSLEPTTRAAQEINERARHEPRSSRGNELRHAPGCRCCGPSRRDGRTWRAADGSKAFPFARPWQISH